MKNERIQLTEQLYIETYPFSDYITCVEVYLNGKSVNAFCSDADAIDEWIENPDVLEELCNQHVVQEGKWETESKETRMTLGHGLEVEIYSFSDDICCINVYRNSDFVSSFCSDRNSIDEWQDDPEAMESIVKSFLK